MGTRSLDTAAPQYCTQLYEYGTRHSPYSYEYGRRCPSVTRPGPATWPALLGLMPWACPPALAGALAGVGGGPVIKS